MCSYLNADLPMLIFKGYSLTHIFTSEATQFKPSTPSIKDKILTFLN
jgi:hypothetical protein